ncbi:MAG: indole-3-glycerol phosphate synthase TrpC [Planctomycetes bacterium]|nr:indole-3-glycerol phosphate synthase TrpC [Planctomycetota bacterium]
MEDILNKILRSKKLEIMAAQQKIPLESLQEQVTGLSGCRDFYRTLTERHVRGINVIGEIKKASPSAGLICRDFDPEKLAGIYQECGVEAISVLTDEQFFQGRLDYLRLVKEVVSLPVLRKDFIIDPYQVYESRVAGADAILLIAEALGPAELKELMILARSLGMTVLLEVHELESLLEFGRMVGRGELYSSLLGINNRNLRTMKTDISTSLRLKDYAVDKNALISESGIRTRGDVEHLIQAGFCGILIGETLMSSDDIAGKFAELFNPKGEN